MGTETKQSTKSRAINIFLKFLLFKVARCLSNIASVMLFLMTAITFITVVGRRLPVASGWLIGGYELTESLMAWLSILGVAFCWYKNGHIRIEIIKMYVSARVQEILNAIASFIGMILFFFVAWSVFLLAVKSLSFGSSTEYFRIPFALLQGGFALIALHFVIVLARSFFGYLLKAFGRQTEPWAIIEE
jgi:TRAP-type transport system small permease protein